MSLRGKGKDRDIMARIHPKLVTIRNIISPKTSMPEFTLQLAQKEEAKLFKNKSFSRLRKNQEELLYGKKNKKK